MSVVNAEPPSVARGAQTGWEGFRVASPDGHVGYVDAVRRDGASGRALSFTVRVGRIVVLAVPVERIARVSLRERLLFLECGPSGFAP